MKKAIRQWIEYHNEIVQVAAFSPPQAETMPSPFPGMNPYFEQSYDWEEFHLKFIARTQEVLFSLIGAKYIVKAETRPLLHERSAEERRYFGKADVGIVEGTGLGRDAFAATLVAPMQLELPAVDVEKERYIEVIDKQHRRVVTVIELLSPSNKTPGSDRDAYLSKREQLLHRQVHFVEIDLRRGGQRPTPPALPPCDYYALVSRVEDRPLVGLWPFGLRDPLPILPIPLCAPDPAVPMNLKEILDHVYDVTGFGDHIYEQVPEPPLGAADNEWARSIAGLTPDP